MLLSVPAAINAAKGVDCKIASGGGRMQVTMDRYEVRREQWDASARVWSFRVGPVQDAQGGREQSRAELRNLRPSMACASTGQNPHSKPWLLPSCCCVLQADWNIVKRGWHAHVLGKAPHTFTDAVTAVKTLRVGGAQEGDSRKQAGTTVVGRVPSPAMQSLP